VILFAISKYIIQMYVEVLYRKESKCGVSGLGSLEMALDYRFVSVKKSDPESRFSHN
jgi:hypothetical protein